MHPVLAYYALAFGISWGGMLMVIVAGGSYIPATSDQFTRLIGLVIPFTLLGPSIAGLIMTGLADGTAGYRGLAARLVKWRVGIRWYAAAVLIAPAVFTAGLLALSLISPIFVPGIVATSDKAPLVLTALVAAVMVGFFEELGWTGFAVLKLRLRYGVLTTGLIAGVLWGAWHILGNAVWGGPSSGGHGAYPDEVPVVIYMSLASLGLLVGQLPAFRVLMVWVYDRTESLLVVMLMHASLDAATFILGPLAIQGLATLGYGLVVAALMWAVVGVVALANHGHLTRPQPVQTKSNAGASDRVMAGALG
jgi:membrane protease YdiL (CAAX protease family)